MIFFLVMPMASSRFRSDTFDHAAPGQPAQSESEMLAGEAFSSLIADVSEAPLADPRNGIASPSSTRRGEAKPEAGVIDPQRVRAAQITLALDTAVTGTIEIDLHTELTKVSAGVQRLLGYDESGTRAAPLKLTEMVHPDDALTIMLARDRSIQTGEVFDQTYRLRRHDGSWVWVRGVGRTIADAQGNPVVFAGFLHDISAAREIEKRLRGSERRYRTMFSASPLPMLVLDAGLHHIIEVNLAAQSLYGFQAGTLVSQPVSKLFDSDQVERFEALATDLETAGVRSLQMRHVRHDGTLLEVECRVCPMRSGGQQGAVLLVNDLTERFAARAEIRRLAAIDPLTQLPNRIAMSVRLEQAIERARAEGKCGALLHINLDSFKSINDALGYDGANQLLVEIAARLTHEMSGSGSVARVAGDEFVVLIDRLDSSEAQASARAERLANRMLDAIREPVRLDGTHYLVTASIGVALFDADARSAENALRSADAAVERSRLLGRNQVRFCDPSMQHAVERRAALEMDLRRALLADQFELYYQVQVDKSMRARGAEVLLRWNHPERGMIPPLEFIGLAEETGTILAIGRWVLEQACARLARWADDEQFARLGLSVNVSARQFRQPDFVVQVRESLAITGADPALLTLELTESLLLDYAEEAIRKMNEIRALGVRFSLDDFGTGYSSLAYLKRLPLDEMKIDRAFTRDILTDSSDAVIVRTIIGMARNLGLDLIVEGVESIEQHDVLASWGCGHFQGFYYGKPLPVSDFMRTIENALERSRGSALRAASLN